LVNRQGHHVCRNTGDAVVFAEIIDQIFGDGVPGRIEVRDDQQDELSFPAISEPGSHLVLRPGCPHNAGLLKGALREIYIPRIQRGNDYFAANVLGASGPLISVLVHFFEHGRWGSLVETAIEEQRLSAEDRLFILMQVMDSEWLSNCPSQGVIVFIEFAMR
jgi:hypothetical protein